MANIEIYTSNHCPYCNRAKSLFKQMGVEYKEINITDSGEEAIRELAEKTGAYTVPQIFIDGKFVGGFDDVNALYQSGELQKLI